MEITNILMWVVALVAVVASVVAVWKVGGTASERLTEMEAAVKEAYRWVVSAEETWKSGVISGADKHAWVLSQIKHVFPDFSDELLNAAIKAAVGLLKLASGVELKKDNTNVTPVDTRPEVVIQSDQLL